MTDFTITGADAADQGPAGCVVRFVRAGVAGDNAAAAAELHPDSLAGIAGGVHAPSGIVAAEVGDLEAHEGCVHVPTQLLGSDGTGQRFVFVVRAFTGPEGGDRCGIDLEQSMNATFGGDPAQMMEDALRAAVAPLGEAMSHMGEAIGDAFGGGGGMDGGPAPRRIAMDEPVADQGGEPPSSLVAHLLEIDLRRRIQRSDPGDEFQASTELWVKVRLDLDPAWTAQKCLGVTVETAASIEGEDLRPHDAGDDLGAESYSSWERDRRDFYFKLPLATPVHEFSGLDSLTGTVRLDAMGGELLEIVLGPLGDLMGRPLPLAAFGLEIEIGRDETGSLAVRGPAGWFDRLSELRPYDVTGSELNDSWSQSGDGETSTRVYGSDIPDDATLRVRFWSRVGTLSVPFTTEGMPARM